MANSLVPGHIVAMKKRIFQVFQLSLLHHSEYVWPFRNLGVCNNWSHGWFKGEIQFCLVKIVSIVFKHISIMSLNTGIAWFIWKLHKAGQCFLDIFFLPYLVRTMLWKFPLQHQFQEELRLLLASGWLQILLDFEYPKTKGISKWKSWKDEQNHQGNPHPIFFLPLCSFLTAGSLLKKME